MLRPGSAAVVARLFPGAEWPADGGLTHLLLRLRSVGDAGDPHLEVEAVLRHSKAGDGVGITARAAAAWLQRAKDDPQFRAVRELWGSLVQEVDGTDLVLRLDLGRARDGAPNASIPPGLPRGPPPVPREALRFSLRRRRPDAVVGVVRALPQTRNRRQSRHWRPRCDS